MTDITVQVGPRSSVAIIRGQTPAAQEWLELNCVYEPWQLWGGGIAVEPRCVADILCGAADAGLTYAAEG